MQMRLEVNHTLRQVHVQRKDGVFHVTIDGATHVVDAVRIDPSTWSLLVHGADGLGRLSVAAALSPGGLPGALNVHLEGRVVAVQVQNGSGLGRRRVAGATGAGPQRVLAPMPGKVVRVLVAPGDEVKARQALVVVEAMKMENELRAARDGHVRDVSVVEGQSVDAGTVLVLVE
jgi:acetyl/propionyl-CoA carboxylase alpha subunit